MTQPTVAVKVWGEFALFTRPELNVERVSYPMMTPSAARGVLDAILYKPQMKWHVRRISVLRPMTFAGGISKEVMDRPFRLISFRRNEIEGRVRVGEVKAWMQGKKPVVPFLVDSAGKEGVQGQNRTQRNSLVLHHVAYLIEASVRLTAKANRPRTQPEDDEDHGPDTVAKYVGIFQRRVAKGQCFHRPYLGIREFAAHFAPPDCTQQPLAWGTRENPESLGFMVHDLRFDQNGTNQPGFFDAKVTAGILHCDTEDQGPNGEPPVTVYW